MVGSRRGSAAAARLADWVQGDDTHANAAPPAQTPRARKYTPRESRGDPHGWPEKCIPLRALPSRCELIKRRYLSRVSWSCGRAADVRVFGLR